MSVTYLVSNCEQNRGRCYQHDRVRTIVNVLDMLAAAAAVVRWTFVKHLFIYLFI